MEVDFFELSGGVWIFQAAALNFIKGKSFPYFFPITTGLFLKHVRMCGRFYSYIPEIYAF